MFQYHHQVTGFPCGQGNFPLLPLYIVLVPVLYPILDPASVMQCLPVDITYYILLCDFDDDILKNAWRSLLQQLCCRFNDLLPEMLGGY